MRFSPDIFNARQRRSASARLARVGRVAAGHAAKGFTLVEMLVTVAIIITLLSILIVALNLATQRARGASTQFRLNAISQALVRFKEDIGYYPPVLNDDRGLFDPWGPDHEPGTTDDIVDGSGSADLQDWYSITSLAEYLIGYGNHAQDGYGVIDPAGTAVYPRETPPLGIRTPGRDGVWNAVIDPLVPGPIDGALIQRDPPIDGPVYGPYLDLKDENLFGSVDSDGNVWLPGEGGYDGTYEDGDDPDPKTIVDAGGRPIRYYRRVYSPGSLDTIYRNPQRNEWTPNLADIWVLRPYEIPTGQAIDRPEFGNDEPPNPYFEDTAGDTSITAALQSAEFALLSFGADRTVDDTVRYDTDTAFNEDNLVELGP